ncbi:unnamed protein product, partial [Nesidiocoris tenuis]
MWILLALNSTSHRHQGINDEADWTSRRFFVRTLWASNLVAYADLTSTTLP